MCGSSTERSEGMPEQLIQPQHAGSTAPNGSKGRHPAFIIQVLVFVPVERRATDFRGSGLVQCVVRVSNAVTCPSRSMSGSRLKPPLSKTATLTAESASSRARLRPAGLAPMMQTST